MRRYKIDNNTIWEDTGRISVHSGDQRTWFCRVYRQFKKSSLGWQEIDGPPEYLDNYPLEVTSLIEIIATCQATLGQILPIYYNLEDKIIKNENEFSR